MKISIVTFHYAHNYGAVLQAYALRTYLRRQGHDVTIENYVNENDQGKYVRKLPYPYGLTDLLRMDGLRHKLQKNLDARYARKPWNRKYARFDSFVRETLLEGKTEPMTLERLSQNGSDAYIAGSDQIWNCYITGGPDPVYFLDFPTSAKKIFYGASNGTAQISEDIRGYVQSALHDATAISTRESGLARNMADFLEKPVVTVADPTLLLDREDYDKLLPARKTTPDAYVFAYYLSESQAMDAVAGQVARALGLPLVELHYYASRDRKNKHQRADLGPREFLEHIRNAAFVVTNSFHGTVFSTIYQKKFYSVYDSDERKDGYLSNLGLLSRKARGVQDVDLNRSIDYTEPCKKLRAMREQSETFLKEALESIEQEEIHYE